MIKKTEAGAEISRSTVVRGRVQGTEPLSVAGRIEGSVVLDAKLTIEKSGVVKADVDADEVIVRGILIGNVHAKRAVRIESGARVKGDIEAPTVAIADGARFSGGLTIGDPESARALLPSYEPEQVRERAAAKNVPPEVIMRPVPVERTRPRVVVKKRT